MAFSRILTGYDLSFLSVNTFGVYLIFDAIISNPSVLAAMIGLISTLITVGFNLYKLYRDNNKSDEQEPRRFRLRGKKDD